MTDSTEPFAGVRVLELSSGAAGRTAGMLLADLGADVARVVSPDESVDVWDVGQLCWDRSKTLVSGGPWAQKAEIWVRRLAQRADVVLSDARPTVLRSAGMTAADLLPVMPGLVHVWLAPIGPRGRWSELPDDPLLLNAVGGFAAYHPALVDRPIAPVVPLVNYVHGALGAAAVASAIWARFHGGAGQSVTVSGLQAMGAVLGTMMVDGLDVPEVFSPGKALRGAPNFRLYQARDGEWLFVAALSPELFFGALEVLDRMDVLARPDVGGEFSRILVPEVGAAVGDELQSTFSERSAQEWIDRFRAADVPAAVASTRQEWMDSDVVRANGARLELEHSELGRVVLPGIPVRLSVTPGSVSHLPSSDQAVAPDQLWADAPSGGCFAKVSAGSGSSFREVDAPAGSGIDGVDAPAGSGVDGVDAPAGSGIDGVDAPAGSGIDGVGVPARQLPLAGLRIVDISTFLAAPFASAVLADFGAEVVKVEPPAGDPYRVFSVSFVAVNQRKHMVALDLHHEDGRAALLDLVGRADVFVDNLRPASLARLGLDEDALTSANPMLVRASVSAFGHEGSWAELPGFDPILQVLSGLATAQGGGGDPVTTTAPVHDVATGAITAFGVIAALVARTRRGFGQRVATSLTATSTFLQSAELTSFDGRPPPLVGGVDFAGPSLAHRYYQAVDGWLAVAATTEAQLAGLRRTTGGALSSTSSDSEAAARLEAVLASETVEHWVTELSIRGVPACRVLGRYRPLDDEFLVENEFSHVVDDPVLGRLRVARGYADWSAARHRTAAGGRRIGQDTRQILQAAGIAPERLDDLLASGAAVGHDTVVDAGGAARS